MQQSTAQPQMVSSFGSLKLIQDLVDYHITIEIKDSNDWHVNTKQLKVSKNVIHFLEPDDELVGIKILSISKLDKKFENVPVEEDTTVLASLNLKFFDIDAHYEKWFFDGIYGETLVFLNDDIKDFTHDALKKELIESTMAEADGKITVERTGEFSFFNFNFKHDEDEL